MDIIGGPHDDRSIQDQIGKVRADLEAFEDAAPAERDLPAFGPLESWLFRGGQPTREGYKWLASHGFHCVVDLRTHEESQEMAESAPEIEPVHIPVKNHHPPTIAQARQWLLLCQRHRTDGKMYVHCNDGHGRASTFAMLVRIAQGWDLQRAMEEQSAYGFPLSERAQITFLEECHRAVRSGETPLPML